MSFLMSSNIFHGFGFGTGKPDGFKPVAIPSGDGVHLVGAESEQSTLARKLDIVDSTASGSTWVNPEAVKAKLII